MRRSGREAEARPEPERVERPAAVTRSGDRERPQVARRRGIRPRCVSWLRRGGWAWLCQRFERSDPRHGGRAPGRSALLILLAASGCERLRSEPDTKADAATESAAPRLEIDLPAGIDVSVDGQAHGTTPIDGIEVAPGPHAIALTTACGTIDLAAFEVSASGTTRLVHRDVADLKVARLRIAARKLDGSAVTPTVTINDRVVALDDEGEAEIPACKLRLRVTADGLGAFQEDLEVGAAERIVREVVLAPGPDMVRMPGGRFVLGPPELLPDDGDYAGDTMANYVVEIDPFDIDRTEVTAEQYVACWKAGGCKINNREDRALALTDTVDIDSRGPCSVRMRIDERRTKTQGPFALTVAPERGDHPANCIARWQAVEYCKWVGKRLPTDVEWEFAARGGDSDATCPNDALQKRANRCFRFATVPVPRGWAENKTHPVCAFEDDVTKQGVCDMVWGVEEYVVGVVLKGRPELATAVGHSKCRGQVSGWFGQEMGTSPSWTGVDCPDHWQSVRTGFRCARSVTRSTRRIGDGERSTQ